MSFKQRIVILIIFLLAIVLRLIAAYEISHTILWGHHFLDGRYYHEKAIRIAEGGPWQEEVLFMGPAYSFVLAVYYVIFGASTWTPVIIQCFLGGLHILLIFLIVRHLIGLRAAWLAIIIAAFYKPSIFYDQTLLLPSLTFTTNLLLCLFLVYAWQNGKWHHWLGAGVFFGLSLLVRPNIMLLLPIVALGALIFSEKGRRLHQTLKCSVCFTVCGFLAVLPFSIANARLGGEGVWLTSSGGINFFIGNNPDATGYFTTPKNMRPGTAELIIDSTQLASQELGRELTPAENSRYWFGRALEFMKQQPANAILLMLKKMALFWNNFEAPVNLNMYYFETLSYVLNWVPFVFGMLVPFCFVGLIAGVQRFRELFPLYAFLLTYFAALTLFFVLSHYRIAAVPYIIGFASLGFWKAIEAFKSGGRKQLIWMLPVMGFGSVLALWPWEEPTFNLMHYNIGGIYFEKEDYVQAEHHFRQALEGDRDFFYAKYSLAMVIAKQDRHEEAINLYHQILTANPGFAEAYLKLGRSYFALGALAEAEEAFRNAVLKDLKQVLAYEHLAVTLLQTNRPMDALVIIQQGLDVDPDNGVLLKDMGNAYFRLDQADRALDAYERALIAGEQSSELFHNLAMTCMKLRKPQLAVKYLQNGLEVHKGSTELQLLLSQAYIESQRFQEAVQLLDQIIAANPRQLEAYFKKAFIVGFIGSKEQAVELYKQVLQIDANNPRAHYFLAVSYATMKPPNKALALEHTRLAQQYGFPIPQRFRELLNSLPE